MPHLGTLSRVTEETLLDAIEKMEKRKADRRQNALEALGLDSKRERQVTAAREDAARRNSQPADPTMRDFSADPPKRDPRL